MGVRRQKGRERKGQERYRVKELMEDGNDDDEDEANDAER